MATKISELSIHLTLDSRGVLKGAKVAKGGLDGVDKEAREAQKSLDNMDKRMRAMSRTMQGIGTAALSFVSLRAVLGDVSNSLREMGELVDRATTLGVRTDELMEFTHALERLGVESGQVEASLGRFRRRAGEAATTGGGPAAKAFEELGFEAKELAEEGLPALGRIFDAISSKYATDAERMAVATKIFGDDARSMINAVNAGSVALDEMRQEARDLGIVIEDELAREMKEADETITNFNKSFDTKRVQLYADVIKSLGGDADNTSRRMQNLAGGVLELAEALVPNTREFAGLRNFFAEAREDQNRRIASTFDLVEPVPRAERLRKIAEAEAATAEAESLDTAVTAATRLLDDGMSLWHRASEEASMAFSTAAFDFKTAFESIAPAVSKFADEFYGEAAREALPGAIGATDARTAEARAQASRDRQQGMMVELLREIRDEARRPAVEVSGYGLPGVGAEIG